MVKIIFNRILTTHIQLIFGENFLSVGFHKVKSSMVDDRISEN
jgi:hypothetical protein